MAETEKTQGSATRWGPRFGERADDWAETWEGPTGYGTLLYQHVLEHARISTGTNLLDCGCGAGRFARMAADKGAKVAGIDASQALIEIAARRTPVGDFRVGDVEALPWPDDSFDQVTGFNVFQFADDKNRALEEAGRVSRGAVHVVVPSRVAESGITAVFKQLFPLFPQEALQSMKQSGMFALSEPGKLDGTLKEVRLNIEHDTEIECPIVFDDTSVAVRAFLGAGPASVAVRHSGEDAVKKATGQALASFTGPDGSVTLPAWYRVVSAR